MFLALQSHGALITDAGSFRLIGITTARLLCNAEPG
jgi:hypothetical protein